MAVTKRVVVSWRNAKKYDLIIVALAGGYRRVAGGRWCWSHKSGATQAEINPFVDDACLQHIYTILMRTNRPNSPVVYSWSTISCNKSARRGGAPQATLDKRRHRNCFQTWPLQATPIFSTTTIYMLSVTDFYRKGTISEVRIHAGAKFGHTGCWSIAKCSQSSCRNDTGGFRSWPPATCRFSSRRSFDHHSKGTVELEWPCGWEYKQALSCLVASSGRLRIKEKYVPEIHCISICPKLY